MQIDPIPGAEPAPPAAPSRAARRETTLSIVVPVFNEEPTIRVFVEGIKPALAELRDLLGPDGRTEILFVDDGSKDGTVVEIGKIKLPGTTIRLVRLSRNFGKDAALAAGLSCARGDAVIPMDVDLQDPPGVLAGMVDAWLRGARVVNAVRADRSSDTWLKRKTSAAFYGVFNRLSTTPIESNAGDFRLLDREVVDIINAMPERVRFMKGIFSWVGYSPVDIPYSRAPRAVGETKWRMWVLWNFALDGITGTSTFPLRVWSYLGAGLAVIALAYACFIILRTLVFGIDTPGYASLMVVTLIIGATILLALGIMGEYIGRIAIEVRQRPLFLIRDIVEVGGPAEPDRVP